MTSRLSYEEKLAIKQAPSQESQLIVYHTSSKLICELSSDNEVKNFKLKLLSICHALAISNVPSKEYLASVFVFIQRNYGKELTLQEVSYAFELYALDKLPVKRDSYSSLSFPFIASVLNSYKVYREPQLRNYKKPTLEQGATHITWLQHGKLMHETFLKFISDNNKLPIIGDYEAAFDYLISVKEIVMTREEKVAYKDTYKYNELIKVGELKRDFKISHEDYNKRVIELTDNEQLSKLCRAQRAIEYYQQKLIKTKK